MPNELMGATFNTPKDLRHLAEQEFGQLFVPTEVLSRSAHATVIALSPPGQDRIVVHAERERHWYPFQITHVETPRANGRAVA